MELELKQITKRFSDTIAVDNFSVKLNYGVIGLLGENGAENHINTNNFFFNETHQRPSFTKRKRYFRYG